MTRVSFRYDSSSELSLNAKNTSLHRVQTPAEALSDLKVGVHGGCPDDGGVDGGAALHGGAVRQLHEGGRGLVPQDGDDRQRRPELLGAALVTGPDVQLSHGKTRVSPQVSHSINQSVSQYINQ